MSEAVTLTQKFYRAYVEVLHGDRKISNFVASAGLGLSGVGIRGTITIDYKPGEEVDVARVSRAMDSIMASSDRENAEFKILSYKALELRLVDCQ